MFRSRTLTTTTFNARITIIKNNHAESKKIAVKVYMVRAETEELNVQKQNAEDDDTQDPHHQHLEEASLRRSLRQSTPR
jgi:hypothetical protein